MKRDEIITIATKVHGNKYMYDEVAENVRMNDSVVICCPNHGKFTPRLRRFLNGSGCVYCAGKGRKTKVEFIKEATILHHKKYDYSKVEYKNAHTKVCIICPIHGEFWQTPTCHLAPSGCPKCKSEKLRMHFALSIDDFIKKSRDIHGDKYDYSEVRYVNNSIPVKIICPIHGEFWQCPQAHFSGKGCPTCNESHLEREVRLFLDRNNIKYVSQCRFEFLGKQSVDFYLPDRNLAIECQGKQHFGLGGWNGDTNEIIERDKNKAKILKENGIELIYYTTEEKNLVLEHESRLYNEENTEFSLKFLEK